MATVSIQVPMLETKLPVQTVANARCRNGRNGDTRVGWAGLVTGPGYPGRPGPAGALRQGQPEQVGRLRGAAQPAAALDDGQLAGEGAAGGGAEHRDRSGIDRGADILQGGADGQVPLADPVGVGGGDREPEEVAGLRGAGDAGRPLEQQPLGGEP